MRRARPRTRSRSPVSPTADFGWNINDPGHGFVIANAERPIDAGVASPLSASGTWGPLLVATDGAALSEPLDTYLLDLKPGYADDPTRAVYNHIWLIGDTSALSVDLQGRSTISRRSPR